MINNKIEQHYMLYNDKDVKAKQGIILDLSLLVSLNFLKVNQFLVN